MFSSIKRGARLAAVVGISAAVVVGMAGPASAAHAAGNNYAYGIDASGLIEAGPFSEALFPDGPTTDTLLTAEVVGLLSSGTIVTNAGPTSADATVEDLSVTLAALTTLTASAVSSECSYNEQTAELTGSSSIANGVVTTQVPLLPPIVINLDASPAPNTTVSVPGVAEITLNRQVFALDGSLTVDAIYIDILSGTQTVTIASSTCRPAVLVIPVIAPQFAAGAGVLGLLVLGFFMYRRRQSSAAAAA